MFSDKIRYTCVCLHVQPWTDLRSVISLIFLPSTDSICEVLPHQIKNYLIGILKKLTINILSIFCKCIIFVCIHIYDSEKAMAPYSSTLAWKIPWTEEPGGLQSTGSQRVGHDWATSNFTFHFHALKKEMATHSSVLAWRITGDGGAWWAAVYGVAKGAVVHIHNGVLLSH